MNNPLVSVIIPTTDKEGRLVESAVRSIENSTYKNVEIIIVNEGKERSAQRNIGIDRAKGEYLLILDSDQMVSIRLIEQCVNLCHQFGFDAVYIPERIITEGWFAKLRDWERQFYTGTAIDCVRFVRIKDCPKFDETMSGPEDSDWDRRITGKRVVSNAGLCHWDRIGFLDYFNKKAYYCKSMKRFAEKNPKDKCLNFWWRCFGVYFENGKWKKVLARPDLFICLMGLIFLRGIIYKWPR